MRGTTRRSIAWMLGGLLWAVGGPLPAQEAPPQLDREKVHDLVRNLVEKQTEMSVASIECDEDISQVVGYRFTCVAVTGEGASLPIRIEVIGPKGHVNALLDDPRIDEVFGPTMDTVVEAVAAADTETILSLASEEFRTAVGDPKAWASELHCRSDSLGTRVGADGELYGWIDPEAGRGFVLLELEHERGHAEIGVTFGREGEEWRIIGTRFGTRISLGSLPEVRALDEPARVALDRAVAADWGALYAGIADPWRDRTTPDQLRETLDPRRQAWGALYEVQLEGISLSGDRAYPELRYTAVFAGGTGTYRATLMRCGDVWKPMRMNVELDGSEEASGS